MRYWLNFLIRTLTAGFTLVVVGHGLIWAQGMMGRGDHMMGGRHMREMMQRMMGDMLPPPMDPAFLPDPNSEGARLLQQYCAQCHNLPGPGLHTAAEWPAVVNRMNRRMRMMGRHGMMMMERVESPSRQENVVILDYLQAHAQQPLTARLSPALESKAGQAFRASCAQCHALPDPGQHSSWEWPAVVERMKGYITAMGKVVPNESELTAITGFLQRHAGTEGIEPREQERP
jgi:cytochrome c2